MLQNIPPEITICSFSIIGILTGYIWNDQGKKISALKKKQDERPCNIVCIRLESIETNIAWIKEELKNKR